MKLLILCVLMSAVAAFSEDAKPKSWDFQNNPYRINKNFVATLAKLPITGSIEDTGIGWPGYYWASVKGGISQRWQTPMERNKDNFRYDLYSFNQLRSLSSLELSKLSPAEKYDILKGDYSYPTVERVRKQTRRSNRIWEGICHGVAPAGLHHPEPSEKVLTNPHGLAVEFNSSDIKALLGYYYGKVTTKGITQIGSKCRRSKRGIFKGSNCNDINPGSFHIILTNLLGIQRSSFVADIDGYKEVWNHVAVKFKSDILGRTDEGLRVRTSVWYTGGVDPSVQPIMGTENAILDKRDYEYILSLENGDIIGGEWISDEMPDFIWVNEKEAFDHPYFGDIGQLL